MSSNEVHRMRLLWAGFVAILAAGVGFAIRGGIFDNWAGEYGGASVQEANTKTSTETNKSRYRRMLAV